MIRIYLSSVTLSRRYIRFGTFPHLRAASRAQSWLFGAQMWEFKTAFSATNYRKTFFSEAVFGPDSSLPNQYRRIAENALAEGRKTLRGTAP
ncbi:MAG: hypothetical protein ACJ8ER_12375 [Allosphingosinicella sp.]